MKMKDFQKQLHKLDRTAVERLAELYRLPLLGFAFSYVRDEAVAEDVVSDAFVRLLVKQPRLRDECALKSYLFSTTKNIALDCLRKKKREKASVALIKQDGVRNAEWFVEHRLIENERQKELSEAMTALNDDYREALYLCYFEEMSIEEIARTMGRTKKQTYNLLARAKKSLAEILGKEEES